MSGENQEVDRSLERIEEDDLCKLRDLARAKLDNLFERKPFSSKFKNHLRFMVLAQGAAQHFVDHGNGVKDFDVWCFFDKVDGDSYAPKVILHADFGESKFGRHPHDPPERYLGRRVDIMGRSCDFPYGSDAAGVVLNWLRAGNGNSPVMLRKKSVVGLWPDEYLAKVLWRPAK